MLFSQRAIFQANANRTPPAIKLNFESTSESYTGSRYLDTKSYEYSVRAPTPGGWSMTSSFDNSALENGFGYCGSCTFKHKTASNYYWQEESEWGDIFPGYDQMINSGGWSGVYMFDGVFVQTFDPETFANTGEFLPVSLAKTTTTNKLAFLFEYGSFDGVQFDLDFDDLAGRWLTVTWSNATPGVLSNFSHDSTTYGPANGSVDLRVCLWDAQTGELLGKTDKKTFDGFAILSNTRTNYTWAFDQDWSRYPILDFELNNNTDYAAIQVSSVWYTVGGTPWDPMVIGTEAIGTKLPEYIGGRRAVVNMTITEVAQAEGTDFLYGFRPAIASVTNPVNSINYIDATNNPINNEGV